MEKINCEKMEMRTLTAEVNESYSDQTKCHVSKKNLKIKMIKNIVKFR